jgi:Ser/Thr protein kinase RdoA (MazF antagonist)
LAGKLLAGFHNATPGAFCKHRNYWDAEGLAGYKPTFGSYDRLKNIAPAEQKLISMAGRTIYAKLKAYENKFPEKMGLIHADLHFGNVLQGKGNLRAIDFDDCGLGFHVYDLVIPYMGALGIMDNEKKNKSDLYFEALIKGYETSRVFSKEDETLFHYLFACRKILMLGWLNSRSDNPRLCAMLPIRAKAAVEHIQKNSHLFKVLKWSI